MSDRNDDKARQRKRADRRRMVGQIDDSRREKALGPSSHGPGYLSPPELSGRRHKPRTRAPHSHTAPKRAGSMHTYDYSSRHRVYRRKPQTGRWMLAILVLAAVLGAVAFVATRPASVRITASPADARIVVENIGEGSGSLSVSKATPGRYDLIVSAPDYVTHKREIILERAMHTEVKVQLKRKP